MPGVLINEVLKCYQTMQILIRELEGNGTSICIFSPKQSISNRSLCSENDYSLVRESAIKN